MQRIDLNFCKRRGAPRAARMLLVVAAAFALDVGITYQDVQKSLLRKEAMAARAQPRGAAARANPEELALARETVQRLSTPWDSLFGALEQAASDKVALLAIQPDPKAGTVVISGDSKDYLAALTYVLSLGRAEALSRVQLVRHEVKTDDPQRPVAFSVSASWKEGG